MIINHNLPAQNTLRKSQQNEANAANSLEKLSSGLRINRAADDPSGLCISERMRSQIREMDTCEMNVDLGISVCDVADGALGSITDMLQRCRELSVQAASTTYTTEDCQEIEKEMTQLFDEISHITKDTQFNTIPLFSGQLKKFYEESIKTLPPGELTDWKDLDFVPDTTFSKAEPAKEASFEMPLDGLKNGADLVGKSFAYTDSYGYKYMYQFYDPATTSIADLPPAPAGFQSVFNIPISSSATQQDVQNVFQGLPFPNAHTELKDGKLIIYQYAHTAVNEVKDSDPPYKIDVPQANGEIGNNASISGIDNPGLGTIAFVPPYDYGTDQEQKESVLPLNSGNLNWATTSPLFADQLKDLEKNTLHIGDKNGDKVIVHFTTGNETDSGKDVYVKITSPMSRKDIFDALKAKNIPDVKFIEDASNKLSVEFTSGSKQTDGATDVYMYEECPVKTPGAPEERGPLSGYDAFSKASVSATAKAPSGPEGVTTFEVSVGSPVKGSSISIRAGGYIFNLYLYDSDDWNGANTPEWSAQPTNFVPIDIKGLSQEQLAQKVSYYISTYANVSVDPANTDLSAGKLAFIHNFNGDRTGDVAVNAAPANSITHVTKPAVPTIFETNPIMANQLSDTFNDYFYLKTPPAIQLDLTDFINEDGTLKNMDNLKNLGFKWKKTDSNGIVREYIFELHNGDKQRADSIGIDVSGCRSAEDLSAAIANAVNGYKDTDKKNIKPKPATCNYSIIGSPQKDASGKFTGQIDLTFSGMKTTYPTKNLVEKYTDGVPGFSPLFGSDEQKFSGGTWIKAPQTSINFSGADMDSLRGTGFRVTCATCKGEYVNVIFCGGNTPPVPESFETEVDGVMRTIQNVVIDINNVSNSAELVRAIVDQGNAKMHHFTEFAVDPENPNQLIARDKRWGDIYDAGILQQAEILPSVRTNFEMDVTIGFEKVNYPMKIYVGSSPHQSIDIELPVLSLEELGLDKPRPIKLRPVEEATAWLGRIEDATAFISGKRSTIGANKNRLEYAKEQLQTASINTSDSQSRIRDLDMAKEMVKYMKDSILAQTSQAMQVQANSRPQSVLELLR